MIKPLLLGQTQFPVNLIQGPLAGISCAPFRRLVSLYSKPAFTCTEMISCKTILHSASKTLKRYIEKDPLEGPVCFQLSSTVPEELAEAVKRVTDYGADLIDLNCGCPKKKIREKGAGSRLLSDPEKLFRLMRALKENTHLPVSIKIRVEGGDDIFNHEIAKVVNDAGIDFLNVHGRHWTEQYETPCRHDEIQFFVENINVPVIGNGDVACLSSLQKMLATGCAGAMIGRAGVGQPWLIGELIATMRGEFFQKPSSAEIASIFLQHVTDLISLQESEISAIFEARKFAKYYARGVSDRTAFCEEVNQCMTMTELEKICLRYF